jgi:hypothetical protein
VVVVVLAEGGNGDEEEAEQTFHKWILAKIPSS